MYRHSCWEWKALLVFHKFYFDNMFRQHTHSARLSPHHRAHQKTAKATYGSNTHTEKKNHLRDTGMTTGHNNTVSTHRAHLPICLSHVHTHDNQTTLPTTCYRTITKNPRRDNLTESRPDNSSSINNEDLQAPHKFHIYCLLPVPPDPAAA